MFVKRPFKKSIMNFCYHLIEFMNPTWSELPFEITVFSSISMIYSVLVCPWNIFTSFLNRICNSCWSILFILWICLSPSLFYMFWVVIFHAKKCYCFMLILNSVTSKTPLLALLLSWFLSSLSYCVTKTTSTVLYTSNEHRRPYHVSDFSGIASKKFMLGNDICWGLWFIKLECPCDA